MCTGAEIIAAAGATSAAAGAVSAYDARRDAKAQAAEQERQRNQMARESANRATAKNQLQRRALRENSLTTGAGVATPDAGRTTLGV